MHDEFYTHTENPPSKQVINGFTKGVLKLIWGHLFILLQKNPNFKTSANISRTANMCGSPCGLEGWWVYSGWDACIKTQVCCSLPLLSFPFVSFAPLTLSFSSPVFGSVPHSFKVLSLPVCLSPPATHMMSFQYAWKVICLAGEMKRAESEGSGDDFVWITGQFMVLSNCLDVLTIHSSQMEVEGHIFQTYNVAPVFLSLPLVKLGGERIHGPWVWWRCVCSGFKTKLKWRRHAEWK